MTGVVRIKRVSVLRTAGHSESAMNERSGGDEEVFGGGAASSTQPLHPRVRPSLSGLRQKLSFGMARNEAHKHERARATCAC